MKRLVFCFDGTWNTLAAPIPTNVVVTAESVVPRASDGTAQVIFYDEGVGTKKWEQVRGGMFGLGLVENMADAYRFLIFNYTPGDELYVFGFSRGAYTARSFVGLLSNCGILHRSQAARAGEAIERYRAREKSPSYLEAMMKFRADFAPDVCISDDEDVWRVGNCLGYVKESAHRLRVTYLGVWDTVGALGIPKRFTLLNPFSNNKKYEFHDVSLSAFVRSARHAVAIDERRVDFVPTLWDNLEELTRAAGSDFSREDAPYQQKWFPGTHSSVGGGGDRRGLSDQAMDWVLDGARHLGLQLDKSPRSPIFKLTPDACEYLEDAAEPGLMYKAMNAVSAADRLPGPAHLFEVSMSARKRWKHKPENLKDKIAYRPATLNGVADALNALSDDDVGLTVPDLKEGEFTLYDVKTGDNLSEIAKNKLGAGKFWRLIYDANRDKLDHPDRIYVGQVLRIPSNPPAEVEAVVKP
jgi:uncharacterized protein (DUF2235 family)